MLPPIIPEGECHPFKFWFANKIQDGMFYRNELFYRVQTVANGQRTELYQQACRLAQRDTILMTVSVEQYSLWISLRNPNLLLLAQGKTEPVG